LRSLNTLAPAVSLKSWLATRSSVPSTKYPVPSTQYQYSGSSTQDPVQGSGSPRPLRAEAQEYSTCTCTSTCTGTGSTDPARPPRGAETRGGRSGTCPYGTRWLGENRIPRPQKGPGADQRTG
jgi:hypothetical protein